MSSVRSTGSGALPIFLGGSVAATLDLLYAFARQAGRGHTPEWVLQSVASGWLGEGAFMGGLPSALLGLFSHYGIVFVAAAIYLFASRAVPMLHRHAVACGAVFGVLVYLLMNFVVLPYSAFPFHLEYTLARLAEGFASHAVFVGIPIAVAVQRWG